MSKNSKLDEVKEKIPISVKIKNNVTILYKDHRGKYRSISRHNATGYGILTLVSSAAKGEFDGNLVPCFLGATYTKQNAEGINEEVLAFNQLLHFDKQPRVYQAENPAETNPRISDTIEYSFIIPAGTIVSTESIEKLKLYNNYVNISDNGINDRLALCAEIDLKQKLNKSEISNLKVYWRISFADISAYIS